MRKGVRLTLGVAAKTGADSADAAHARPPLWPDIIKYECREWRFEPDQIELGLCRAEEGVTAELERCPGSFPSLCSHWPSRRRATAWPVRVE